MRVRPLLARHRQNPSRDRVSVRACLAGHRVQFVTPPMGRPPLRSQAQDTSKRAAAPVVHPAARVDEVGYIPFDPEAASLMFSLVSGRYEAVADRASNKPFVARREIFGDPAAAAAMVDRLIHHAEVSRSRATPTACATAPLPTARRAKRAAHARPSSGLTFNRGEWSSFERP